MEARATRAIAAEPAAIYDFLAEPDRHWQLLGRRLEPMRAYDGERSQVRLRGPLGIRRTLWIRMALEDPPREIVGRVEAGGGATIGTVRWCIRTADEHRARERGTGPSTGSVVELVARTEVAGAVDRLLLLAGGGVWLGRSLRLVLANLEQRVAPRP